MPLRPPPRSGVAGGGRQGGNFPYLCRLITDQSQPSEMDMSRSSREPNRPGQRGHTAFAKYLRDAESRGIKNIQTMTGVDISDQRPENLRLIDAVADERTRATLRRRGEIEGY